MLLSGGAPADSSCFSNHAGHPAERDGELPELRRRCARRGWRAA
jgi:hypothetical protein